MPLIPYQEPVTAVATAVRAGRARPGDAGRELVQHRACRPAPADDAEADAVVEAEAEVEAEVEAEAEAAAADADAVVAVAAEVAAEAEAGAEAGADAAANAANAANAAVAAVAETAAAAAANADAEAEAATAAGADAAAANAAVAAVAATAAFAAANAASDAAAEPEAEAIDLTTVLADRTATRTFSPRRPQAMRLARVAASALHHDASQWPFADHGPPPNLILAAYRVAGLEPGLHRWSDTTGEFQPAGRPPWFPDLQVRYSAAPAIFLLHDNLLRTNAEGYGGLLVRVGSLGYGLWLAARTHGLDACAYGGASPEVTAFLRGADTSDRHLFTLALGHALTPAAGRPPG